MSPTVGPSSGTATAGTDLGPSGPRRRRWRRRRVILATVGALVLVWAGWTVACALVAAHRLDAVRHELTGLIHQQSGDRTLLQHQLVREREVARSAAALVGQPAPWLAGQLPVLGRSVDAERTVAQTAAAALDAGLAVLQATDDLGTGHGGADIARMRSAAAALGAAEDGLAPHLRRLAALDTGWTPPPVTDGVRTARDQLLGLGEELRRARSALLALSGMLGGDGRRTVLVGLMNNAELRGAGGLLSAYAVGSADGGRLDLGPFRDVDAVSQPPARARAVPAPADYRAAYGPYLANTTLWKNVTMSPHGDDSAAVLAAVTGESLGIHPDEVLLLDVPAAAAIVSATGPVTIDGRQVTGAELTRALLVDAYGDGSLSSAQQARRRRVLTEAASQAFERVSGNATPTPALLRALADAADGRHLLLWSDRTDEEARLLDARVAGAVRPDGGDVVMPVTNNLGDRPSEGNKLDYYVDRSVDVDVRLRPDSATVTQTLTLHNDAPSGLGPYVEGLAHPGRVDELLSFDVAADATLLGLSRDGRPADVTVSHPSGSTRLTTAFDLVRGATTTYRLVYRLPVTGGRYTLALVPQALARPATLHLHVAAVGGELGVTRGVAQPRGGAVDVRGPWTSARQVVVPVHGYRGLRGVVHDIARFWNHRFDF